MNRLPERGFGVPKARAALGIDRPDVDEGAGLHVAKTPDLHRDPFDRLLVAQALLAGMVLLTPDDAIRQYTARTLW